MGAIHTHRIRVRYHECDVQGVVFNANYVAYFDIALTELWRAVGGTYDAMNRGGVDLMVVEVTARFRAPARSDDEIDLTIEVESLGRTSMVTAHRITRGDELLVEGRMVHVFVDRGTLEKIEVPPVLKESLEGGAPAGPDAWRLRSP